jgi:hypothetical protein
MGRNAVLVPANRVTGQSEHVREEETLTAAQTREASRRRLKEELEKDGDEGGPVVSARNLRRAD